jgi:energy-converting hydrogenase Eha subunit C
MSALMWLLLASLTVVLVGAIAVIVAAFVLSERGMGMRG